MSYISVTDILAQCLNSVEVTFPLSKLLNNITTIEAIFRLLPNFRYPISFVLLGVGHSPFYITKRSEIHIVLSYLRVFVEVVPLKSPPTDCYDKQAKSSSVLPVLLLRNWSCVCPGGICTPNLLLAPSKYFNN